MIITKYLRTRKDGVRLFQTMDIVVDEKNRQPEIDENGNYISTGFQIRQVQTGNLYNTAIDVEDAPYTYGTTNIPIKREKIKKENVREK